MEDASPKIIIKGSLEFENEVAVVAEQVVLFVLHGNLVAATVGFMAANYVFMFRYPASLNNFCLFLQKCVLHINDGKKLPSSVISFVNKLDMFSPCGNC